MRGDTANNFPENDQNSFRSGRLYDHSSLGEILVDYCKVRATEYTNE